MIKCEICGRECKNLVCLSSHIRAHSIKAKDYYDRFVGCPGRCKVCKNPTRFYNMSQGYQLYCSIKCMANDPDIKSKKIKTNNRKYGCNHPLQNQEIYTKFKNSCISSFGVDNPSKAAKIKFKKQNTCFSNFGVDNPSQSKMIQRKKIENCRSKFGCDYPFQNSEIQNKFRLTCLRKYGVDHYTKTPGWRRVNREKFLSRIEHQRLNGLPFEVCIGLKETDCLDILQKYTQYEIIRNPRKIGFFPDGYIQELNLIIEYDEPFHKLKCYYDKDILRQRELEDQLKCIFFRIEEDKWNSNKNEIIKQFQNIIERLK